MAAERIDVRALIKKAADVLDEDYFQMAAVEAAVAELIEAAKLARSYMEHAEWCSEITNGIDGDCDCGHELHRERVNAALARMGEGA